MLMSNRWLAAVLLASALVSSLGCDSEGCPTGTTPGPGETCISSDRPDAGADAISMGDAPDAYVPVDAPSPPDAFMPDAFLVVPDGCVPIEYWNDNDADGFGDRSMLPILACTPPANYAANGDDCNDASASVHPMRAEMCNGVDDNCDGSIDEALRVTVYRDADSDGFGTTEAGSECPGAAGWASVSGDCNDTSDLVNPMRTEICNGIDDNCAMGIDELLRVSLYRDADMDGFGTSVTSSECPGTAGWASVSGDCNDMRDSVNPMRTEVCNGIDDNCTMGIDEMLLSVFYEDADMDGYGANPSLPMCVAPAGYTARAGDCNDMNMSITPGRAEACNGIDDNCSAGPDETFACVLGRAYGCSTTCGTTGSYVCPAGCAIPACTPPVESCNYSDDDCDSYIDEGANAWGGPTNAATSNRRVELLATRTGYLRVLARSGGLYARNYDRSGAAIGTETQLTTTLPALFSATVRDNALFVATFASNTLTGYRFDVSTLAPVVAPVASFIDNTIRLRVVANDDRVFILTDTGGKLDLRVRGRAWDGTDVQRVADGPVDFDLALAATQAASTSPSPCPMQSTSCRSTTRPRSPASFATQRPQGRASPRSPSARRTVAPMRWASSFTTMPGSRATCTSCSSTSTPQ